MNRFKEWFSKKPQSRRDFLRLVGIGSGVTLATLAGIGGNEYRKNREDNLAIENELAEDWQRADISNDVFLEQNAEQLDQVQIGCSFSPEELDHLQVDMPTKDVVNFLVDDLGITDIRFGFRWNNTVNDQGEIDFEKYPAYLKYLKAFINRGVNICLNVGPIKTFRYPEDHVPNTILNELEQDRSLSPNGGTITPDSQLAQVGLDYMEKLFTAVEQKFPDNLQNFTAIQIENEPFIGFGKHEWRMSHEYLLEAIGRIPQSFAHAKVLMNSPGVSSTKSDYQTSLGETADFLRKVGEKYPHLKGKLIAGVDYYYTTPNASKIPRLNMVQDMNVVLKKREGQNVFDIHRKMAEKYGFEIEMTETQVEPWEGTNWGNSGNSAHEWRFALLRSLDVINSDKPSVIRMWGVEHLLQMKQKGTWTQDHEEIVELTKKINGAS